MQLCDKYPFLIKYFKNGINNPNRSIAHSILFYGTDTESQYALAKEIARMLNCKTNGGVDCTCQNCEWIRNDTHPAVLTYSKTDNKATDDDSRTVISIKQAQSIKNSLLKGSDFHRVFIFCDKGENGEILGLNETNFQEETANSLLKTIEEPPSNTTFFFLTREKENLISTIVSRSQSFFVPSMKTPEFGYQDVESVFENYWEFERTQVFDLANNLYELGKNIDCSNLLEQMSNYILAVLKTNLTNKQFKMRLMSDISKIETAKKQIASRVSPQTVIENLCFEIIQN